MGKNKGKINGFGGIRDGLQRFFGQQISFHASLGFEGMKEGMEGGMMGSKKDGKSGKENA